MNMDDLLKQVEEMVVTDDIDSLCERLDKITTSLDMKIDLNFEYII